MPIALLKTIHKDAGRHLWDVNKIQPGREPPRREPTSSSGCLRGCKFPWCPSLLRHLKDPNILLTLLHFLSHQKPPTSLDAAKCGYCWPGLAPCNCPRASASMDQLSWWQLAGKTPVQVAILRYRQRQSSPCPVKPQHWAAAFFPSESVELLFRPYI